MDLMPPTSRILLVEDDLQLLRVISQALKHDYEVDTASSGAQALLHVERETYDVIVLDLHLPDANGLAICQTVRARGNSAPILVLSAEARVLTKIHLLDSCANDYLTKPFSLGELKARLRALIRQRHHAPRLDQKLSAGGLTLDRQNHTVEYEGSVINLRRKEFAILECLMDHAGSVVSRQILTSFVWPGNTELWTNAVDVHIKHLRDKIDRQFNAKLIRTVHGIGYKIDITQRVTMGGR
jgi:DNA-binding response OmpR family regulator